MGAPGPPGVHGLIVSMKPNRALASEDFNSFRALQSYTIFIFLLPLVRETQGDVILPFRGEREIKTVMGGEGERRRGAKVG